ncbi:Heat shock protein Hsp33 protein [gut metagenome]|uniref:Heat shock protein Hsp33 protein n=1 Tax=gut metagenome TaxID=749906 RepID=J9GHS6_9ZZZZ
MIKDLGLKEPYVGQVALQTSEIADDLTYYFATSEQVPSAVGLGVLMNKDNTVRQAGGVYRAADALCRGGCDRKTGKK